MLKLYKFEKLLKQFFDRNSNKSKTRSKSKNSRFSKIEVIGQITAATIYKYLVSTNNLIIDNSRVLKRALIKART